MKKFLLFFCLFILVYQAIAQQKARTIITTDGEVDDIDSFIRMLLYSNEFRIEGLVISSSQWHYAGDGLGTKFVSEIDYTKKIYGERTDLRWPGTQWIFDLVNAYRQVYPNLKLHAIGYPSPDTLISLIKIGNIDFEGEMEKETEGATLIKERLLDTNLQPIYLQAWGGTNTIAKALKSIENQYINTPKWKEIYDKVSKKAIIYSISEQDLTYRNYISKNWPNVSMLFNENQFWCLAYMWRKNVPVELHKYFEGEFMSSKILLNKGPLLKMYHSYGDGNAALGEMEDNFSDMKNVKNSQWGIFNKYDFISEGDSPAFLHLVDMGFENLKNPSFGGWSGRLVKSDKSQNRWEDSKKSIEFNPYTKQDDLSYAQTRWVADIQNDFAARANWCVAPYEEANHKPEIQSRKFRSKLNVKPNSKVLLKINATDPDSDSLTYNFWHYKEAGNSDLNLSLKIINNGQCRVQIPWNSKKGDTFHIIAEAKDSGEPTLKNYQRFILKVQ